MTPDDGRLLTPHEIWVWAKQVVAGMSPNDRRLVAEGLSRWGLEDREAAA